MEESIAKLRGIRSGLLIDPSRVTTPQALNARIDSIIATLEACKIDVKPAVTEEPESAPDTSRTRPKKGGHRRVTVTEPEGAEGESE